MLPMVEKGITGGLSHYINRYMKANNKYMKDYDKNRESSYLKYWDENNLYGWVMSQKLPVNGFKLVEDLYEFNEDFLRSYNKKSNEGYFLEVDAQYPESLHEPHNDLQFLPKIKKIDIVKKFVANFHNKKEYIIHIRNLKQELNHRLVLTKVNKIISFNQKLRLKSYVDMNTELQKKANIDFEKYFFKLMNNSVLVKSWKA